MRLTHRILTVIGATLALALASAAPAPAQTIYDYVYSGQYVDGSGSEIGQFTSSTPVAGVAYDQARHRILIAIGGNPAQVVVMKENNVPDEFSGLAPGTDTISTGSDLGEKPTIASNNTGGADDGSFYLSSSPGGSNNFFGYTAAGTPQPSLPRFIEGLCGVTVGPEGNPWTMATASFGLGKSTPSGEETGVRIQTLPYQTRDEYDPFFITQYPCRPKLDSQSFLYGASQTKGFKWTKYAPGGLELFQLSQNESNNAAAAVDLNNDDVFTVEGDQVNQYDREGKKLESFGVPDPGHGFDGFESPGGIAVNTETGDVWVSNQRSYGGKRRIEKFVRELPGIVVPTASVQQVEGEDLQGKNAVLRGTLDPDGLETETCQFLWGLTPAVANSTPCDQGQNLTGSGDIPVTATVPVTKGKLYWYRLQSQNKANQRSIVTGPKKFIGQGKSIVVNPTVDRVNTDGVRFNADIDPNGGQASWTFEYGFEPGFESSTPVVDTLTQTKVEHIGPVVTGLKAGTEYHVRLAVTSEAGTVYGETQTFRTYAPDAAIDRCANASVRQQSGSSRLLDCRGYELVSPRNAGGFDVVSDILAGDTPLSGPPGARDLLLYSVDSGAIPGIAGNPTNLGRDPYVAGRDPETGVWTTRYVGLPANGMQQKGPFGSPLLGTDGSLSLFAFGGADVCDPCFDDGSTNVPLRRADGKLEKGMAGTLNPAANQSQLVRKPLSGDGSHFVFGTEPKFEEAGEEDGTIYDRNLESGTTQVASTTPEGAAIPGGDISELDISDDGERILIGQSLSDDGKGNDYRHLYMHIGTSPNSVDLTEEAVAGALFSGMSRDGSRVFMTTKDHLLAEDTDESADIYEAAIDGGGDLDLRLITTKGGTPSNDDGCLPAGLPESWNTASGMGKCSAVAFAGGAGVAPDNGALYFVSPEKLDGAEGAQDQGNLYFVEPGGDPKFVAVLDTAEGKPGPPPPDHPLEDEEFGGGTFQGPAGLSVDQSNGDVYVAEGNTGKLHRFTAAGAEKDFTAGPSAGTNEIGGFSWFEPAVAQIAVDNSGGPADGRIYVAHAPSFNGQLEVYAPNGEHLAAITGASLPTGHFGIACGVTVDETNGDVYVGDYYGQIWRYTPSGPNLAEGDYSGGVKTGSFSASCGVAIAGGNVYTNLYEQGRILRYQKSVFALSPPEPEGVEVATSATGVSSDQTRGEIYVDRGNRISIFNSSETLIGTVEENPLFESLSSAVNSMTQEVYATADQDAVLRFGAKSVPYTPIDNRAILNGARHPETHRYGDFQVSADGTYAAFATRQPVTGFNTQGFEQVYRYDSDGDELSCVTCAPSGAVPAADTGLPEHGLGLTDDGRVFFTTSESFALRDTNEKLDAYEWKEGEIQLISFGLGPEHSKLLTVTPDGTDAFFFTRDTLVAEDENGSTIKIYDARAGGGLLHNPPLLPCAASDECHGPGTQAPPPPEINTQKGSGRSFEPSVQKKCRKGFRKKSGKCVKKKKQKKAKRGGRR